MSSKTRTISLHFESGEIDYKAEVIASEFIRMGVSETEITYSSKSNFKRKFEKDVQNIFLENQPGKSESKVSMHVNREGLYDMLPEGLFHFDEEKIKERAKKEGVTVSKLKKQQETEARKFFQPIETEFYSLLTKLQLKESENLSYFSSELNKSLFYQLYGYIPDFNDNQIAKLLYFLPLAYKLKGNIKMIGYILENLLDIRVELECKEKFEIMDFPNQMNLKEMQLGLNSVVGPPISLLNYNVLINFYDLNTVNISSYFENGNNFKIVEKVMSFFLPVGYTYKVIHHFEEDSKYAFIENEEHNSFMGYNSFL